MACPQCGRTWMSAGSRFPDLEWPATLLNGPSRRRGPVSPERLEELRRPISQLRPGLRIDPGSSFGRARLIARRFKEMPDFAEMGFGVLLACSESARAVCGDLDLPLLPVDTTDARLRVSEVVVPIGPRLANSED